MRVAAGGFQVDARVTLARMPEYQRLLGNFQTVWVGWSELDFVAVERDGGRATVIRFRIPDPDLRRGDVLVVLEQAEVWFHGMISTVDPDGWAVAADPRGSKIPAI